MFEEIHFFANHSSHELNYIVFAALEEPRQFRQILVLFDDGVHDLQAPHSVFQRFFTLQLALIKRFEGHELNFLKALVYRIATVFFINYDSFVGTSNLQLEGSLFLEFHID